MVVHPAAGNFDGTLVNALMHHCGESLSGINGVMRPGIVHRIDKNTSGLLMVAKNDAAHNGLAEQIKEHSFTRTV
jgi:23S rRNA pseudouridine1911/1915/1917 synthase